MHQPVQRLAKTIHFALLAALVVFELGVLYLIFNPQVSDLYRAYFIDRTTDCWPRDVSGRIAIGQRVSFLKGEATGTASHLKTCGWIPATDTGTFSNGSESRLHLSIGRKPEPLLLELELRPVVTDNHPTQRVIPFVNGLELAPLVLDISSDTTQSIAFPAAAIGEDGFVDVVFRFPDARSPRELGLSDDPRQLAIRLVSLRLLPSLTGM